MPIYGDPSAVGAPALPRRCDVHTKYASRLHPSCGWVPGVAPRIWAFLSGLGNNESVSILLRQTTVEPRTEAAAGRRQLLMAANPSSASFSLAWLSSDSARVRRSNRKIFGFPSRSDSKTMNRPSALRDGKPSKAVR